MASNFMRPTIYKLESVVINLERGQVINLMARVNHERVHFYHGSRAPPPTCHFRAERGN